CTSHYVTIILLSSSSRRDHLDLHSFPTRRSSDLLIYALSQYKAFCSVHNCIWILIFLIIGWIFRKDLDIDPLLAYRTDILISPAVSIIELIVIIKEDFSVPFLHIRSRIHSLRRSILLKRFI